ncbi:unnamed protein product [Leuciscus chuanchicus]
MVVGSERLICFDFYSEKSGFLNIDGALEDGSFERLAPNCRMKLIEAEGKPHLCLFALKEITAGTEITYDYGGKEWPWRKEIPPTVTSTAAQESIKDQTRERPEVQSCNMTSGSSACELSSFPWLDDHAHDLEPNVFSTDLFRDTALRAECQSSSPSPQGQCGTSCAKEGIGEVGVQHQEDSPPVFSTDLTSTESRSGCQSSRATPNDFQMFLFYFFIHDIICVCKGFIFISCFEFFFQYTIHKLVFELVRIDKCWICHSPLTSIRWHGVRCKQCCGVWHKICLQKSSEDWDISDDDVSSGDEYIPESVSDSESSGTELSVELPEPSKKLDGHLNENAEIAQALQFPKSSKERKHNSIVKTTGSGCLKVKRSSKQSSSPEMYDYCCTVRVCYPEKNRVIDIASAQSTMSQPISSELWSVLGKMHKDGVSTAIRNDHYLMQFAQSLFNKHGSDRSKHEYTRQKVTELGRLLVTLHHTTRIHNMEEAIKPGNFFILTSAVKRVSGFDHENNTFKAPKRKISDLIMCRAHMEEDQEGIDSIRRFYTLHETKWSELVSHPALSNLSKAKYNKSSRLPLVKDVQKLQLYLGQQVELAKEKLAVNPTAGTYAALAKVTLCQVILFNGRREGEVAQMTEKDFEGRDMSQLNDDISTGLTEVKGKKGRKVAVILTANLSLLTSKRKECEVTESNNYLFAIPCCDGHYRGQFGQFADACGAEDPQNLRSTNLRKQIATISQVMNLKDNELDQLADFLGHDIRVHREYYRLPQSTIQLAKISKLLMAMEKGSVHNFWDVVYLQRGPFAKMKKTDVNGKPHLCLFALDDIKEGEEILLDELDIDESGSPDCDTTTSDKMHSLTSKASKTGEEPSSSQNTIDCVDFTPNHPFKVSKLLKAQGLISSDNQVVKNTSEFLEVHENKWNEMISATALRNISEAKWNVPTIMPFTEDWFKTLSGSPSTKAWMELAKVCLAQMILFNRRREGEVSSMPLSAFLSRDTSDPHEDVDWAFFEVKKNNLCRHFTRVITMGARGRPVPVLLTSKMLCALELLTNPYMFARPEAMPHFRGSYCIRGFAKACDAKCPKSLTSTRLRKHAATLSTVLNMTDTEMDQLANFLGHDIRIHCEFNQLPEKTLQLAKISKVLMALEQGRLAEFHGNNLDEIGIDPDEM